MKKLKSLFANKFVNEDSELIQKSLVIAHQNYVSREKYDDAIKISKIISENLDKDGCFVLAATNITLNKFNSQLDLEVRISSLLKILWGMFSSPSKYNLK